MNPTEQQPGSWNDAYAQRGAFPQQPYPPYVPPTGGYYAPPQSAGQPNYPSEAPYAPRGPREKRPRRHNRDHGHSRYPHRGPNLSDDLGAEIDRAIAVLVHIRHGGDRNKLASALDKVYGGKQSLEDRITRKEEGAEKREKKLSGKKLERQQKRKAFREMLREERRKAAAESKAQEAGGEKGEETAATAAAADGTTADGTTAQEVVKEVKEEVHEQVQEVLKRTAPAESDELEDWDD